MDSLLILFVALPFLGFLITLFFKNKEERSINIIVRAVTIIVLLGSLGAAGYWALNDFLLVNKQVITLYQTDGFAFVIQMYYDGITAVYSMTGSVIFFLVATFSKYYMHRDEGFKRFFASLLFFMVGFNLIIFSGNFETLFIGWESIGLASFLLIAFYRNRYLPVKNAFKTLSIYRLSDVALILAMWMMHHLMHQNINFSQLAEAANVAVENQHGNMALFIMTMVLLAAIAKSAQFPFTSWLPRAMEGPTSSSAIFYGSLSVHIGVFLLLRTYPFWQDMAGIKIAILVVGGLTAIIATFIARVQPTVKTQIAYSSVAQIGLIFIEIAFGLHILALIHFAGNAFLRTYQLLVSPSVLNYLVHHQYFHHEQGTGTGKNKLLNTLYTLSIKEWNLDRNLFRFLWMPFKWTGRQLAFLESSSIRIFLSILAIVALYISFAGGNMIPDFEYLPVVSMAIALLVILYSFSSRASSSTAWMYLIIAHIFIIAAILFNQPAVDQAQILMYMSGILLAGTCGLISLGKIHAVDRDTSLDKYHGYVYEQKGTALAFLLSAIALLGFPITAAFIGIDVFFTHIGSGQTVLITLTALCFIFIELAAIRIYCRIFLGLHKKLSHPVAFRSS